MVCFVLIRSSHFNRFKCGAYLGPRQYHRYEKKEENRNTNPYQYKYIFSCCAFIYVNLIIEFSHLPRYRITTLDMFGVWPNYKT